MTTTQSDGAPVASPDDTRVVGSASVASAPNYPFLRPSTAPGELGRIGNYRVLHLLGCGGMGKVFLAEDMALKRPVALKVMCLPPGEDLLSWRERFLREARALAAIKHPNLVTVYQVGDDRGTVFLAMEVLEGETLEARLRRESPFDVPELLRVAEQIATGLVVIHERQLIHRDIKPANIWLCSQATQDTEPLGDDDDEAAPVAGVKILDFGLVREVHEDTRLTEAGAVMGTPAYMSPEQVRGQLLDHRTDLFSFGCVLYAMATGGAPFAAENALAQAAALAADEPVRARKINPKLPRSLSNLIAELLAKDPDDRPASAAEVVERLREVGRGDSRSERRARTEARPSFRRHAVKLVAGVWLVLAVLVAVAATCDRWQPGRSGTSSDMKAPDGEPVVYLSDLPRLDELPFPPPGAPLPPGVDGTVTVGGVRSPHGVFMHGGPPHDVPPFASYSLQKKCARFNAEVVMNDTARGPGTLTFVVLGDGRELWRSRSISVGEPADRCDADVRGVSVLRLEVHTNGPNRGAHGAWVEPRLTK